MKNHIVYLSIDDQELIHKIKSGDNEAFNSLYDRFCKPLVNFAQNYIPDREACEEVVQEFFIQLYIKRFHLQINSSLSAYLHVALRNTIFNHIRNKTVYKKHIRIAGGTQISAYNNVDDFIRVGEIRRELSHCLAIMPPKYKEIYVLYMQEMLPIKKIAEILNRPASTVDKQLRKALLFLRSHFQRELRIETGINKVQLSAN